MAVTSQAAVISACKFSFSTARWNPGKTRIFIRASSSDETDCNSEECAPEKEVGKVSMEWVAEERTKVVGTFPPRTRGWTGYIEKDTAGQTNIYSVEPAVYIAESAISSGNQGSSADGSENTAGFIAFLALISVAAASSILLQVGKSAPKVQVTPYSGPPLTYYIDKLKPPPVETSLDAPEIVQAPVTVLDSSESQSETALPAESSEAQSETALPAESSEAQSETAVPAEPLTSGDPN